MKRPVSIVARYAIFVFWLGGLWAGLFSSELDDRIVGMLLWIGIGAGHRLSKIEETLTAIMESQGQPIQRP